jgi:membrane protein required for colicin V production
MNPLDIAVVAVVVLSAVFAFARGFVREALSIVAWAGAAAITWYTADYTKSLALGFVSDDLLARLLAYGCTFIASLIVLTIATSLIARLFHYTGMSGIDRTLGFIFGLARGALILCLVYLLAVDYIFPPEGRPLWLKEAKSAPYLDEGAAKLRVLIPEPLKTKSAEAARDLLRSADPKGAAKAEAEKAMRALQNPSPAAPAATNPDPAASPTQPAAPTYKPTDKRELDRLIGNQH